MDVKIENINGQKFIERYEMELKDLIGKWAVRTKPVMVVQVSSGFGGIAHDIPDSAHCTNPVFVTAIEQGVVYIEYKELYNDKVKRGILNPKYIDENWALVNRKYLEPCNVVDIKNNK